MRRSSLVRRTGGNHDLYGAAEKRRPIRRRRHMLPSRTERLFVGSDRGQVPPFPLGLASIADFQAHVLEVPPWGRGPGTDRRHTTAPGIPRGASGLRGHPRIRRRARGGRRSGPLT